MTQVLSNTRMALENIIKYGILIDPLKWARIIFNEPNKSAPFWLLVGSNIFILFSFILERFLLAPRLLSNRTGAILSLFIVLSLLSLPPIVFQREHCNPVFASVCCFVYSIISLKLTSYHMVNYWCRKSGTIRRPSHSRNSSLDLKPLNGKSLSNGERALSDTNLDQHDTFDSVAIGLVTYPSNLNLKDLYYFIFAPTLCYELNFPRSDRIRKRFLMKRFLELVILVISIVQLTNSLFCSYF